LVPAGTTRLKQNFRHKDDLLGWSTLRLKEFREKSLIIEGGGLETLEKNVHRIQMI
jgi:hypothetical protein